MTATTQKEENMSFRVQFTISDEEHEALKKQAEAEGFPNVAELCKNRSLSPLPGRRRDYGELYRVMVQKIGARQTEDPFTLRDLIDTPPALLGRWLYDNVANGKIPDVEHIGPDPSGAEQYKKIIRKENEDAH